MKAFLYAQGAEDVWGHSVAELSDQAGRLDKDFRNLKSKISPLDKFYVPTRYPNGLPGGIPSEAFDEEDAERALALAEEAVGFVRRKLEQVAGGQ